MIAPVIKIFVTVLAAKLPLHPTCSGYANPGAIGNTVPCEPFGAAMKRNPPLHPWNPGGNDPLEDCPPFFRTEATISEADNVPRAAACDSGFGELSEFSQAITPTPSADAANVQTWLSIVEMQVRGSRGQTHSAKLPVTVRTLRKRTQPVRRSQF